jgi:WD40 repeat protein
MARRRETYRPTEGECTDGGARLKGGRAKLGLLSREQVVLLLSGAILLAWLVAPAPVPEGGRMRLVRGEPGAKVLALAFAPDGQSIATVHTDRRVLLRQVDDPLTIRSLDFPGLPKALAFSADGRFLAVGGIEPDIRWFDLKTPEPGRCLGMPIRCVRALAFSPDGQTLAATSELHHDIVLWEPGAGRERSVLRGFSSPVHRIVFSPDGKSLASGAITDNAILIWDLATGRVRLRLEVTSGPVLSLAFSPAGTLLASSGPFEHRVGVWDLRSGRLERTIAGHSYATNSVAFSPDGSLLATAGGDGTVKLWSVATGRLLDRLDGRADWLSSVAFSPDGRVLAATGGGDDVRFWDLVKPQCSPRPVRTAPHRDE